MSNQIQWLFPGNTGNDVICCITWQVTLIQSRSHDQTATWWHTSLSSRKSVNMDVTSCLADLSASALCMQLAPGSAQRLWMTSDLSVTLSQGNMLHMIFAWVTKLQQINSADLLLVPSNFTWRVMLQFSTGPWRHQNKQQTCARLCFGCEKSALINFMTSHDVTGPWMAGQSLLITYKNRASWQGLGLNDVSCCLSHQMTAERAQTRLIMTLLWAVFSVTNLDSTFITLTSKLHQRKKGGKSEGFSSKS